MVEDASARADGGDPEAPAEAPPANENSRRTRSSRRRLERVLTESSLKAEDHDGDRADVKLNENQYALTSSEWSCRGDDPDATVCRAPEACT